MRFQGRRALVTGASSGVGRAVAVLLASEGAHVAIHYDRDTEAAEKTATACGMASGTVPMVVRADLSKWEEGAHCVETAAVELGGLDLFVGTESYRAGARTDLEELDEELWNQVLNVDLRGAFTTARTAGRLMRQKGGSIVLAGAAAASGSRLDLPQTLAQAGVLTLTRLLARDLAPKVRVNAVALGSIAAPWLERLTEAERADLVDHIPVHRVGRPEEAARAILYLASDDAAFVTGQTLVVDGGELMR